MMAGIENIDMCKAMILPFHHLGSRAEIIDMMRNEHTKKVPIAVVWLGPCVPPTLDDVDAAIYLKLPRFNFGVAVLDSKTDVVKTDVVKTLGLSELTSELEFEQLKIAPNVMIVEVRRNLTRLQTTLFFQLKFTSNKKQTLVVGKFI